MTRTHSILLTALLSLFAMQTAWSAGGSTRPTVVHGSATFQQAGGNLNVKTGSNKTIINWQTFGVPFGTTTQFKQPRPSSAVLNKVTGRFPSGIHGSLLSNGRVYLINPNGIVIGPTGVINTRSFIASALPVSDSSFLAGEMHFTGSSDATVVNLGSIEASKGDVLLIAPHVENRGSIKATRGRVDLVAGQDVLLTKDHQIYIQPKDNADESGAAGTGVLNTGNIEAVRASLQAQGNLYALAINNEGTIHATGVVRKNGRILLRADGGNIRNTGNLSAKTIKRGGKTVGGEIQVLAEIVLLEGNGTVVASGDLGGGKINIGGNYQGKGPLLNAQKTYVGSGVKIEADSFKAGDAGQVIIWADNKTLFLGDISAQAHGKNGDGGFVEVSGKKWLGFRGTVSTASANGKIGTLLLDPEKDLIISNGPNDDITEAPADTFSSDDVSTTGGASNLQVSVLQTALASNDVIVITSGGNLGTGGQTGKIIVNNNIAWASAQSLTLQAIDTIEINADITASNAGAALILDAGNGAAGGVSQGNNDLISVNTLTLQGDGNVVLTQKNLVSNLGGSVNGSIEFTNDQALNVNALSTSGQAITVTLPGTSNAGITIAGNLNAGGGDVTLIADAFISQNANAVITGDTLILENTAAGNITLTEANKVNALSITGTNNGTIAFTNDQALSVNAVTTSNDNVSLITTTGGLDLTADVAIGTGNLTLTSKAAIAQSGGIITAQDLLLNIVAGGAGAFTLEQANNIDTVTALTAINGNISVSNDQDLTTNSLSTASNQNITLKTTSAGKIDINADMNAGAGTVTLDSTGAVTTLATNIITANRLNLMGTGNVTLTNSNPVALLGSTTTGNINFTANGALELSNQSGDFTGGNVTITHDSGTLTVSSNLAISGNFSEASSGNNAVTINANIDTSSGSAKTVTINEALTLNGNITTDGGTIRFNSTVDLTGGTSLATGTNAGDVNFQTNLTTTGSNSLAVNTGTGDIIFLGNVGTGGSQLSSIALTTTKGTALDLAANFFTSGAMTITANTGVNQSNGAITASTLDLNRNGQTSGDWILDRTNSVGTLTADAGGSISFTNGQALILGNSIVTTNASGAGDLTITHGANTLTVTGPVTLKGSFSENGGGQVTLGSGGLTVGQNESITFGSTLKVDGSASLSTTNTTGTGTITLTDVIITQAGDDLSITAGSGGVDLQGDLGTSGAKLDQVVINSGGGVTQTAGKKIFGSDLQITGTGNFSLATDVSNINTNGTSVSGAISITNDNALSLTSGTFEATGDILLKTLAGGIDLSQDLTSSGGRVTLDSANGTSSNGKVTGTELLLLGGGNFTLLTDVGTLATGTLAANSVVNITDDDALTIGTVLANSGIKFASGGTVTLETSGAASDLTVSQAISGTTITLDTLDLLALGANVTGTTVNLLAKRVTQSAGSLDATNLNLEAQGGTGNFALNTATNTIANLATTGAGVAGSNSVFSDAGTTNLGDITTTGTGPFTINHQAGTLNIAGDINLTGSFTENGSGNVFVTNAGGATITVSTGQNINFSNVVTLNQDLTLDTGSGNIFFKNATPSVNDSSAGTHTLDLTGGSINNLNIGTSLGALNITTGSTSGLNANGDYKASNVTLTTTSTNTNADIIVNADITASTLTLDSQQTVDLRSDINTTTLTVNAKELIQTIVVGKEVTTTNLVLESQNGNGDFTLGEVTNSINNIRTNGTGVNGNIAITSAAGSTTLGNILTTGAPAGKGSLSVIHDSGTLNINGTIALDQGFTESSTGAGGVSVTGVSSITSGNNQDITFNNVLTLSQNLTLNAGAADGAGAIVFKAVAGSVNANSAGNHTLDLTGKTLTNLDIGIRLDTLNITSGEAAGLTVSNTFKANNIAITTTDAAADLTVSANITSDTLTLSSQGTVDLNSTIINTSGGATFSVNAQTLTQTAGTVSASAVILQSQSGDGDFTLNQAGNSFSSLTTTGGGSDEVRGDLNITSNPSVSLTLLAIDTSNAPGVKGSLTVNHSGKPLIITGPITLNGSFAENGGGQVTLGGNLAVGSNESISFSGALQITGSASLSTTDTLGTGSITLNDVTITNPGDDLSLTAGSTGITLNGNLGTSGNPLDDININTSGSLTQAAGKTIFGATLSLQGDGNFGTTVNPLNTSVNSLNSVGQLGGTLVITNNKALALSGTGVDATGDISLTTTAGGISVANALISGGNVTLNAASGANGAGLVSGTDLLLLGGGNFNLTTSVDKVATSNLGAGSVTVSNNQSLIVGTVGTNSGITAGGGINLAANGGGSNLTLDDSLNAAGNTIGLIWGGSLTQNAGGTLAANLLNLEGPNGGTLTLDVNGVSNLGTTGGGVSGSGQIRLTSTGALAFNAFNGGANTVRINASGISTNAGAVLTSDKLQLVSSGAATLTTSINTLAANISGANALSINNNKALVVDQVVTDVTTTGVTATGVTLTTSAGGITLNQNVDANGGNVTLQSAGGATQGGSGNIVDTSTLTLLGGGTFTLTNGGNAFSALTSNGSAIGGDVSATSSLAVAVGDLNAGNNAVTLNTAGTTATGTLTAGALAVSGTGTFTLNTAVNSATANVNGSLTLNETDGFDIAPGGLTANGAGNTITLNTASGDFKGPGTVTATNLVLAGSGANYNLITAIDSLAGTVSGSNLISINNGSKALGVSNFSAASANVNLTAAGITGGSLTATGLLLRGAGTFNLTTTVSTFAQDTTGGTLSLDNTGALTIGTVSGVAGIKTGGQAVTLKTSGLLTMNAGLDAGPALVNLESSGINQTGGSLVAGSLLLAGTGNVSMDQNNNVKNLQANIDGTLSFTTQSGLVIGKVAGPGGIDTQGKDISLTTGDQLDFAALVKAGLGNLTITTNAGGALQRPEGLIDAKGLILKGDGSFTFTEKGNQIDIIVADFTGGSLQFINQRPLVVGKLAGISGITAEDGNVILNSVNGFIKLEPGILITANGDGNGDRVIEGDIRPTNANKSLKGNGTISLIAGRRITQDDIPDENFVPIDAGGGTNTQTDLDDIGDIVNPLGSFNADSLSAQAGDELKLPKELLKAQATLDEIFKQGFNDQFLAVTQKEIQNSLKNVELATELLAMASPVYHSLNNDDELKEKLKLLILSLKNAKLEVRVSNYLVSLFLKRLYLDKMRDRINQDAFKGAIESLRRSNERIALTMPALAACLKVIKDSSPNVSKKDLRALVNQAASKALNGAQKALRDVRERQDRVYNDVLLFDWE